MRASANRFHRRAAEAEVQPGAAGSLRKVHAEFGIGTRTDTARGLALRRRLGGGLEYRQAVAAADRGDGGQRPYGRRGDQRVVEGRMPGAAGYFGYGLRQHAFGRIQQSLLDDS